MQTATTYYFGCLTIRVFTNPETNAIKTVTLWDDVKVHSKTYKGLNTITIDEAVDAAVQVATMTADDALMPSSSSVFDVSFQQV
jgi:hypothetical protein